MIAHTSKRLTAKLRIHHCRHLPSVQFPRRPAPSSDRGVDITRRLLRRLLCPAASCYAKLIYCELQAGNHVSIWARQNPSIDTTSFDVGYRRLSVDVAYTIRRQMSTVSVRSELCRAMREKMLLFM